MFVGIGIGVGRQRMRGGGGVPTFEFSVKTDNAGVSTSTQFRMPLTTSTGLDFDVDWGDGSAIENITNHTLAIHTYASAGTYTISVTGNILGWQFNNGGDKLKMLNVSQWGGLNISVDKGFNGCTNLTASATDAPLITTSSLEYYFQTCAAFNGAIGNWNVSNVTNMLEMFQAGIFNQDIGNWKTLNVTNMGGMFNNNRFFNQNIGAWDVSKVTTFESMFRLAIAFDNNGSNDIGDWIFSSTSNINMQGMFSSSIASLPNKFNRNISNWDVLSVTNMRQMFQNNDSFNQDISNWDINQVGDFRDFMTGATGLSTANYDLLLVGWEAQAPTTGINCNFGGSKYTLGSAAATARASLIATYGWTITDGGGI